jgi:hypothetical protein
VQTSLSGNKPGNNRNVQFSTKAEAIWDTFYITRAETRYAGMIGKLTDRAEVITRRLAMIFALLDGEFIINAQHLLAAIAILDYHIATVLHIYGDKRYDRRGMRLLAGLKASGDKGMTRTEISVDIFSKNLKEVELDEIIEAAVADHLISITDRQNGRGRPAKIHKLSERGINELNGKNPKELLQTIINTPHIYILLYTNNIRSKEELNTPKRDVRPSITTACEDTNKRDGDSAIAAPPVEQEVHTHGADATDATESTESMGMPHMDTEDDISPDDISCALGDVSYATPARQPCTVCSDTSGKCSHAMRQQRDRR